MTLTIERLKAMPRSAALRYFAFAEALRLLSIEKEEQNFHSMSVYCLAGKWHVNMPHPWHMSKTSWDTQPRSEEMLKAAEILNWLVDEFNFQIDPVEVT